MSRSAPLFLAFFIAMISSCTSARINLSWQLPKVPPRTIPLATTEVGAAETDITPPPLHGMSGYSKNGFEAHGFRSRLKARAFYLGFQDGPPQMVIQLDLLSGSLLLHHAVASRIAMTIGVDPGGIMLAGTHTHGGPGNYFESEFYNNWAGTMAGLDKPLFDFLVDQIAEAGLEAYRTRRPGTITTASTHVKGLNHNRSIEAYLNNPHHQEGVKPLDATNTRLSVVRLDILQGGALVPLGGFASFSIHGTSIEPTDVFNGDLFAYVARTAAQAIKGQVNSEKPIVFGILNRTHGDNSPHYTHQGFGEAKRLGSSLGEATAELYLNTKPDPKAKSHSKIAALNIDLSQQTKGENPPLCRPKVGMTVAGGTEDGPTPILYHLPWFGEGWPQKQSYFACQGEKRVLGSFAQNWFVAEQDFPHYALVQLLQINDFALLAFPFEVTLEMGHQLEAPLIKLGYQSENIAVVSCSNGYFGYLTTREEYAKQHYEGGHTLYGPGSGAFFVNVVDHLVQASQDSRFHSELIPNLQFNLSVRADELVARKSWSKNIAWVTSPTIVTSGEAAYLMARWYGGMPSEMGFQFPLLSLDQEDSAHGWQPLSTDDTGDIELRFVKRQGMGAIYEARWYVSDKKLLALPVRFRFGALASQVMVASGAFRSAF